jgi:WD40 repeat protein
MPVFEGSHTKLAEEVINIAGFRFSSVRLAKDHHSGGLVVAAGSHDEPVNTVGIWDTDAIKNADWLMDHKGFKVDGNVTCLEFGATRDSGLLLWAGTSQGSLLLLDARIDDLSVHASEQDGEGAPQKWSLSDVAQRDGGHGESKKTFSGAASSIAVHPENDYAAACGEDGSIWQLNIAMGSVHTSLWSDLGDTVALYDIKYAPNASNFFTAGAAGGLRMWDIRFVF